MRRKAHIGYSIAERMKDFFIGKEPQRQTKQVEKNYEGTDDNFFEATNANLRTVLRLDEKKESYRRDLKRYGTRIRLMDVADDAIPEKRRHVLLPLKAPYKRKCFGEDRKADLKRYGTRPGIIDVSNDACRHKKLKVFPTDFSKAAYEHMIRKWTVRDTHVWSGNPFSDIYRDFPKVQINVRNTTAEEREVLLWGANRKTAANVLQNGDPQQHTLSATISVPGGVHPQGMAVNPANQCLYIANQLSGSVTVLDKQNQVVKLIQLEPAFPGLTSPVSVAINTNPASTTYGFAYVACSVSNHIAVIDLTLHVVTMIAVGVRPIAIAFNGVNNYVYTANLVSDTVTVIHAESFAELPLSPLPTGNDPIGIGVNTSNGDVYITNSISNNITVYNHLNLYITDIVGIGQYPVSVTYNPANDSMYIVAENSNTVYQIHPLTHAITASLATGQKPYNSFFDTANNNLYIQNRGDNTLTVIRPDNSKIEGLSVGRQNIGGAFSAFTNAIYISDTAGNTINRIGYASDSGALVFSPDYEELREDLKNSPAIVQHAKFVVTGPERLNTFRLTRFTPTGRQNSKPLSFELYASPQARLNVAEVTELAGTIIDGKMNWQFRLPGLHSVAILIWFRQLEMADVLSPENIHSKNK